MAHFARVVDGLVVQVHVVANPVITDDEGIEQETLGQEFLSGLHGFPSETFVQCSYSGSFRGLYPAPGFTYDSVREMFIAPAQDDVVFEVPDEAL